MYANMVKAIALTADCGDYTLDHNGIARDKATAIGKAFNTIHDKYSFNTLQAWDDFIGKLTDDDLAAFAIGDYDTTNIVWYECQRAVTEALFGIRM